MASFSTDYEYLSAVIMTCYIIIIFTSSALQVHEDYDCMLNQTNIGNNNNKFYVIQVLTSGKLHYCWTRWGRVVSSEMFVPQITHFPEAPNE